MNNNLKANTGKFHLFLSPYEDQAITVENYFCKSSSVEELLGVTIDSNLKFKEHILSLCKQGNRKLHTLFCVSTCMTFNMYNRGLNKKINHIHERALRIV